jgi:8-hydroxy-5-deazaflavin:NADPH oxidoreductase
MATAIGTRAAKHGHTIELMSRNTAKAQALADQIGNGATAGTFGATPLGDIAIVAVPYTNAVSVVANYGEPLAGKILVDISNPFNADELPVVRFGRRIVVPKAALHELLDLASLDD